MMLLERELSETKATADRKQRLKLVRICTDYYRQVSDFMMIYKQIIFQEHGARSRDQRPNREVLGSILKLDVVSLSKTH